MAVQINGDTGIDTIQDNTVTSAKVMDDSLVDGDINSSASINTSKLKASVSFRGLWSNVSASTSTYTKIPLTMVLDEGNNIANDTFTIPFTGSYLLTGNISHNEHYFNSTDKYLLLSLYKNSVFYDHLAINQGYDTGNAYTQMYVSGAKVYKFNAGDTIEVYGRQDSGNTEGLHGTFSGAFLGV